MRRSRRCPCGKGIISSYRKAERIRNEIDAERVYFCAKSGGYHVTSETQSEYDRKRGSRG